MTPLTPGQARYRAYLQTLHWQALRARILTRAENHCEWCHRFCGPNPHGVDQEVHCDDSDCDWCNYYCDDDGCRNDRELQTLEVHHKTYERLGHEGDDDLSAICWNCHDEVTDRALTLRDLYRAGRIAKDESTPAVAGTRFWDTFLKGMGFRKK